MPAARFPRITPAMLKTKRDIFPELTRALKNRKRFLKSAPVNLARKALASLPDDPYPIPGPTYSMYRDFIRSGNRQRYESLYFQRRRNFILALLRYLFEPTSAGLDVIHDYLWAMCEESTWVLPAHERGGLDLFSTETAFSLAETLHLLERDLAPEIRQRIEYEIRRRVLEPYLRSVGRYSPKRVPFDQVNLTDQFLHPEDYPGWFKFGHNNWNGVCNSSVGASLLYLEKDPKRLARGLNEVLKGLSHFIDVAFEADGASTEGAGYWQYGLINFIAFAELLRNRTAGKIDLLTHPKMKLIARYPLNVLLSPGRFYSHADCSPRAYFVPGVIGRLAERTGVPELKGLVSSTPVLAQRVPTLLRDLLWWDGKKGRAPQITDALLSDAGIFRLRSGRLVLAGKAGHNAECHNHNDVGSFVLHSAGEDLLCDPGCPPYTRQFFSEERYSLHIQANSLGHSVPVVGGRTQEAGREYSGGILRFDPAARTKTVEMEFARAYPVKSLKSLRRTLELAAKRLTVTDLFAFKGRGLPVEEAFVTTLPVSVKGRSAVINSGKCSLLLEVAEPEGARFHLERREIYSHARAASLLTRILVRLPAAKKTIFRLEAVLR